MNWKTVLWAIPAIPLMMVFGSVQAQADVQQIKFYKEAFPDSKPKCLFCHVDKIPKKGDGLHDLNAYGLKVHRNAQEITADHYIEEGTVEEFEQKSAQVDESAEEAVTEKGEQEGGSDKIETEAESKKTE